MVASNKHVFWQALVVALVIFWAGIFLGIYLENSRVEKIEKFYFDSETDIFDFQLVSEIVSDFNLDCDYLRERSVLFADRIYAEALMLEKYDDSNKITKELIYLHKRYDLLRTMLWMNLIQNKERCPSINTIIYLYDYDNPDLAKRGLQGAMSSKLIEVKRKLGDDAILLPIATDTGVESLDVLRGQYELENSPVILINEQYKFENLESLKDIENVFSEN